MQVFSEPDLNNTNNPVIQQDPQSIDTLERRDSYATSQGGDNTYATIQPRNLSQIGDNADYATLRNNSRAPSVSIDFYINKYCKL